MNPFAYLFRFCCDPQRDYRKELNVLERFVQDMGADDVMVFCNVQELNTGHTTVCEQRQYLKLLERTRDVLPEGVTLSVNQWHSLMHMDQGKHLHPGQNFRLMRDIDGLEATLCVCPACGHWLKYIADLYANYASVHPFCIWVEDDFRFHNHAPLRWGGCFCADHMQRFAKIAGQEMRPEELVRFILEPGEPHPYRILWLNICRSDLLVASKAIGDAVEVVAPESRIGLMSSLPQVHAAEGRDWMGILNNFARGTPPVLRIHLPAYSEIAPSVYMQAFNQVSMLNRAFLSDEVEIYPELENFPYSLHTKSRTFVRFQLLSALPLNLRGMTIDLFDLNGSGIVADEGWQQMLSDLHPILNRLQQSGVFGSPRLGVKLLVNANSSYTLHTRYGKDMEELYPSETLFAALFGAFGISFEYLTEIDLLPKGCVVAACGQVLRNYQPSTVEALFDSHFVLLDGDAAETLHDMRLGHLAGIASCKWIEQDNGRISYEQVEDGASYHGIQRARASAMVSCCDVLDIQYLSEAEARCLSGFYGFDRKRVANGQALISERVYIFPFGRRAHATHVPPMLLNSIRSALLAKYLPHPRIAPRAVNLPHLCLYSYALPGILALYCVNASMDAMPLLKFRIGRLKVNQILALGSEGDAEPKEVSYAWDDADFKVYYHLRSLETVLLLIHV